MDRKRHIALCLQVLTASYRGGRVKDSFLYGRWSRPQAWLLSGWLCWLCTHSSPVADFQSCHTQAELLLTTDLQINRELQYSWWWCRARSHQTSSEYACLVAHGCNNISYACMRSLSACLPFFTHCCRHSGLWQSLDHSLPLQRQPILSCVFACALRPRCELCRVKGRLTWGGLQAGRLWPCPVQQLDASHALHGVLGVREPAEGPDEANLDGLDSQIESGEQDRRGHISSCQHIRHVLFQSYLIFSQDLQNHSHLEPSGTPSFNKGQGQ